MMNVTQVLTDEQIRRVAPSIFGTQKHISRSARYTCIPTIEVLNALRGEGFQPVRVYQSGTRDPERQEFTKHMIRLRHESHGLRQVGDEINEVVIVNSHDGSSSYQMMLGIFRLVCSNGMVVRDRTFNDVRVPHRGDVVGKVIEGAYEVLAQAEQITERKEAMKALTLTDDEQQAFGRAALLAKYGEADIPVTVAQALQARRSADHGPDLWRVFNRLQENLVRGGLHAIGANGKHYRTREVRSIDQNVALNRALWVLAEEMRKLKTAA